MNKQKNQKNKSESAAKRSQKNRNRLFFIFQNAYTVRSSRKNENAPSAIANAMR